MRKKIAILGSTGSIGVNTLDVISALRGRFEIVALSADSNAALLSRQSAQFLPKVISIGSELLAKEMRGKIPAKTRIVHGPEGLKEIVGRRDIDLVVFAISGNACLEPLIEAIKNRKTIALANKESLVSAGALVMRLAKKYDVRILPIDSEHSAIFQCLNGKHATDKVIKIYLTGSGGPLLKIPKNKFDRLPLKFILNHPKWKMGRKISVDSATMMNKGLEIIEAMSLFGIDEKFIDVLVHPEAVIHSMVEFVDGAILAQLGIADMRIPIQYALTYPGREKNGLEKMDFGKTKSLSFAKPDTGKFPCLALARRAAKMGGIAPAILCAADEEAVKNYLNGNIKFTDIHKVIETALSRHRNITGREITLSDVLAADRWAREEARSLCYR